MNRKKVIIWGCGMIGKRIFCPLHDKYNAEIIAYTDSKSESYCERIYEVPVIAPDEITQKEYDYVLIAMYGFSSIKEIRKKLIIMGVPEEKIRLITLDSNFVDLFMDQRTFWVKDFSRWIYEQKLDGNVAECGVFRGDSAKFINKFFPDKILHLFDTFEGFEKGDVEYELRLKNPLYVNGKFASKKIFVDTDLEMMMEKMCHPEKIRIHKGYFPETTKGITEKFCFVNLDMDLYLPMIEGLRFFWDKMVVGGCILLHDYFNPELPGVKKAVDDFQEELGTVLCKVTIGDGCSMAIMK